MSKAADILPDLFRSSLVPTVSEEKSLKGKNHATNPNCKVRQNEYSYRGLISLVLIGKIEVLFHGENRIQHRNNTKSVKICSRVAKIIKNLDTRL